MGKKTLVLDIDETLVHSVYENKMKKYKKPDYLIFLDESNSKIFVNKRPGVEIFLKTLSEFYELVIFTASLRTYADPLMDQMDPDGLCTSRLFRDHCSVVHGNYTKDLSRMNRSMKDIMILDNTPNAYMLQPGNAIPITSWNGEPEDTELIELIPLFILLSKIDDCRDPIEKFVFGN